MISSLSGMVMLWATGSPSPMQTPLIKYQDLQLAGLKTLIYTQPQCSHHQVILFPFCYKASVSPTPSSLPPSTSSSFAMLSKNTWSSSSLELDDLIGTDSGVHTISFNSEIGQITTSSENNNNNKHFSYKDRIHDKRASQRAASVAKSEKYPPPIPRLARAGNAAAGRSTLPWVWTRHYTDGKLILQGQPVDRHEYFEARRHDGRLILDLVLKENRNDFHRTKSRSRSKSITKSCSEEELIQFGEEDHKRDDDHLDHDESDDDEDAQSVAVLESLVECLGTDTKGFSHGCGLSMEMHERSNPYSGQASSSAPLVPRPLTSVIM